MLRPSEPQRYWSICITPQLIEVTSDWGFGPLQKLFPISGFVIPLTTEEGLARAKTHTFVEAEQAFVTVLTSLITQENGTGHTEICVSSVQLKYM